MDEDLPPTPAKKRSLVSQIICPLGAMGALFFMLQFAPNPDLAIHDLSALQNFAIWLLSLSVFVVPCIVYKILRAVTDP